ncbi:MAG: radical SAM protein [Paramuribaculum sp.]|nr:radical SAM protein [Paramuribaculum sp.]
MKNSSKTVQCSVITTFRCNARCNMCNIWQFPTRPEEEIDFEQLKKLPDGMRINITGGEPTIRKDIDRLFEILHPKALLLELSTNGYNTETIVRLAKKYPDILIRVSLEGLPAINDSKRGLKDGFDHAMRTMLELRKTKCRNIGFSVVISPDNYKDLLPLYELCVALGVELGNSTVHNSWYFHKDDNKIESEEALAEHEKFVKALLTSRRRGIKAKLKDYGRAYFNRSIHRRLRGDTSDYRPKCGALKDFFFIDPSGNVSPCNGSSNEWIVGNINTQTIENMKESEAWKDAEQKVASCQRNCAFIVTERHDMVRKPWIPVFWILKNKWRIMRGKPIDWE